MYHLYVIHCIVHMCMAVKQVLLPPTKQCGFRFHLFLVLVLVFQLFFRFSFVLVLQYFFISFSFASYFLDLVSFQFYQTC